MESASQPANTAAGIVVGDVGTAPVSSPELPASLRSEIQLLSKERVLTWDHLRQREISWSSVGQNVVFTNGYFDLLYLGHIAVLEQARREGTRLAIGINSDRPFTKVNWPNQANYRAERAYSRAGAAWHRGCRGSVRRTDSAGTDMAIRPEVIVKADHYIVDTVVGAEEGRE